MIGPMWADSRGGRIKGTRRVQPGCYETGFCSHGAVSPTKIICQAPLVFVCRQHRGGGRGEGGRRRELTNGFNARIQPGQQDFVSVVVDSGT